MKPKLYLGTTIPSYLVARPSRDLVVAGHQQITHDWWAKRKNDFDIYVSQFVMDEAGEGDRETAEERLPLLKEFESLDITEEVEELAACLIERGALPQKAATDSLHISVATIHQMGFLMTWNCTHIANAEITPVIRKICLELGYSLPVTCTPEELMAGSLYVERPDS